MNQDAFILMRSKPDLLIVITLLFIVGAMVSSYTIGGPNPNKAAAKITIR